MTDTRTQLLKGTLDLLILKALDLGPNHGYGVARWIEETTEDALQIEEGSLYPALHRMAAREWIACEWRISANNRRAKYYSLTTLGKRQLEAETSSWERLVRAIRLVLQAQPA